MILKDLQRMLICLNVKASKAYLFFGLISLLFVACAEDKNIPPKARKVSSTILQNQTVSQELEQLSAYGFFKGELSKLEPETNVYPYDINTPLFSNYALKERFVYLPDATKMRFEENGPMRFEDGSILIKNFRYEHLEEADQTNASKLVETRLLLNREGKWIPLNYIWNEEQTDAYLNYTGSAVPIKYRHTDGKLKTFEYVVPNNNQCKNCHSIDNEISPVGMTAAQLNKEYSYINTQINQLNYFKTEERLIGMNNLDEVAAMPVWNDVSSGNLENRAHAYLDANCAHCHSKRGSAKNSGLYLEYQQVDQRARGVYKPPVAAGKGSGDFQYGIVPGKAEESIFTYRMASVDPAIRMPELGRSVVHQEGLELIKAYINQMQSSN